jgi:hypothetical protein
MMLFQEFVEQHRVHLIITNGEEFAALISHHQVGFSFFHLLNHLPGLRDAGLGQARARTEGGRPKGQDRFA